MRLNASIVLNNFLQIVINYELFRIFIIIYECTGAVINILQNESQFVRDHPVSIRFLYTATIIIIVTWPAWTTIQIAIDLSS